MLSPPYKCHTFNSCPAPPPKLDLLLATSLLQSMSSIALEPKAPLPKKKKKYTKEGKRAVKKKVKGGSQTLVNSAAESQGARRVGGVSVTPRAQSPCALRPARRPPLPSCPQAPRPGVRTRLPAHSQPRVNLGGVQGSPPGSSPHPPPPGTSAQASKPPLIWTSFLLPLSPQLFITALERGSRAPGLASPISQRGEDGYLGTQESSSPCRCLLRATPHRQQTLGKLFAFY